MLQLQSRKGKEIINNISHNIGARPRISSCDSDWQLEEGLLRFGPVYREGQGSAAVNLKEKSWEQVLRKSAADQEQTTEIYLVAVRNVEQQAMDMYGASCDGSSSFRWMMIKDGVLFLQLALLLIGCGEQLGYPEKDPIFGRERIREEEVNWKVSMFYAGNQIPLVVLRELMRQTFFKEVVAKAKWDAPPSGLCEKVLYEVLVRPSLVERNKQGRSFMQRVMAGGPRGNDEEKQQQQRFHDLLHALRHHLMGRPATHDPDHSQEDEDEDETSSHTIHIDDHHSANGRRVLFLPSATDLKQRGICIKKLKSSEGGGARCIRFQSRYFWANLYLPALPVDQNTELLLRNLQNYDNFHRSEQNGREVCLYLRLMSDLSQTIRDTRLLHSKGIIQGEWADVRKMPAVLDRLRSTEDIRLTPELRRLRNQISDYTSPWVQYKGVLSLVAFLTAIQTVFTVLDYFKSPKQN